MDIPDGKRPAKAFHISNSYLNKHTGRRFQNYGFIDGTRAISLLMAVWYFTDYLLEKKIIDSIDADINRQCCNAVLETCRYFTDCTDPGARMYENFPEPAIPAGNS